MSSSWNTQQWIDCLRKGTNKIRYEYCVNALGRIRYLRAFRGHAGGVKVKPTLQSNVKILYGWTDFFITLEHDEITDSKSTQVSSLEGRVEAKEDRRSS